jgi:hypothetical protein
MKSGGAERPAIQQTEMPVEKDKSTQDKTAARLTKARYQKGFMSTMQSDRSGLGQAGGGIATGGSPTGSVEKLG